jgi:hypothetical protein
MNKPETKIVLVESISMFRMRYAVEVPVDHPEYAGDTVVTGKDIDGNEIAELSQLHLDEVISSMRTVTKEEYIKVFREDNPYINSWTDEKIMEYVNKGYRDESE